MDKGKYGRLDRLVKQKRHDPYQPKEKYPEPTLCPECRAVFKNGRWVWSNELPERPNTALCPACKRIKESMPAGIINISGSFLKTHAQEIINLIKNEEKAEKKEHPLERLMALERNGDNILVKTTGIHIAKRIGESLRKAYQGDYELHYGDGEKTIEIFWKRD